MSMEVSVTSKPISPEATTQVARSTKELIPVKPAEGASPAPSTANRSPLDKPAQPKMALPVGAHPHRPSPITGGSGTQRGSMPANPVSGPAPDPTSGTESAKKDSASTPTRSDESQASATNLILNKDNENPTPGVGDPEDHQETALADEIKELWSSQKRKGASLRRSRVELEALRSSLAERLHTYKDLLARTGRGGKWTEFLRQANIISRTTADRYVEKWNASTSPKPEKRPSGAFNEPSKEEIADMVKKLRPKLVRVLTTPDTVALFMTELAAALQPSTSIV